MNVVVLDLEMNQPSNKIIQIGALKVNLKESGRKNKILVKDIFIEYCNPEEHLNSEIIKLTGISQDIVDNSLVKSNVFGRFWDWLKNA